MYTLINLFEEKSKRHKEMVKKVDKDYNDKIASLKKKFGGTFKKTKNMAKLKWDKDKPANTWRLTHKKDPK